MISLTLMQHAMKQQDNKQQEAASVASHNASDETRVL